MNSLDQSLQRTKKGVDYSDYNDLQTGMKNIALLWGQPG